MAMTVEPAVVLTAPDGSSVRIDRFPVVLGRFHPDASSQPDCDLSVFDPEGRVSRRHLGLDVQNGQLIATDLGSTNGSWVNGHPLTADQPVLVGSSAEITLGHLTLVVALDLSSTLVASAEPSPPVEQVTMVLPTVAPQQAEEPPPPAPPPSPTDESASPLPPVSEPASVPAIPRRPSRAGAAAEGGPRTRAPGRAASPGAARIPVLKAFSDPGVMQLSVQPGRVPRMHRGGEWSQLERGRISAKEWDALMTVWEHTAPADSASARVGVALLDDELMAELILPPVALEPNFLVQRRPAAMSLAGMVKAGRLDKAAAAALRDALAAGRGMVIVGPSSSGRTTLMSALVDVIPGSLRVAVVERRPAGRYTSPNAVRLRSPGGEGAAVAVGMSIEPDWLVIDDAEPADASEASRRIAGGGSSAILVARSSDPPWWRQLATELLSGSVGDADRALRMVNATFPLTVRVSAGGAPITGADVTTA